jgi:hypothetical protein
MRLWRFLIPIPLVAAFTGLIAPAHAALKIVPLACETTSDTTGPLDLAGALSGWLAFGAAGMSNGDTAYYQITNSGKHGEGIGTYNTGTPNTFTRDASENSTDGLATPLTLSGNSTICLGMASGVLTAGVTIMDVASVTVDGEAYGAGWNGDDTVPTKNDTYDKIETLQPLDSELTAFAGLTSAADKCVYFTGSGTASTTDCPTFGRSLMDDTSASGARDTLGATSGIFPSSAGGTGNGFTKFSGPVSSEKTFTLPNANSTVRTAGRRTIQLLASAGAPAAGAAGCTPVVGAVGTPNTVIVRTCQFSASTDNGLHFFFTFQKGDAEATDLAVAIDWTSATTTDGSDVVVWNAQAVCFSNDDGMGANAYPAADTANDTQTAAHDFLRTPEITNITPAGTPAEGDACEMRILRDADNGSDTFNGTADLVSVQLYITQDAANDD